MMYKIVSQGSICERVQMIMQAVYVELKRHEVGCDDRTVSLAYRLLLNQLAEKKRTARQIYSGLLKLSPVKIKN